MKTISVCKVCLEEVPAEVIVSNDVRLIKTCPEHGTVNTVIEVDPVSYVAMNYPTSDFLHEAINTVILNATDRCNQVCRHCYHMPGDDPDPSIAELVHRADASPCPNVILMGAEPTVRNDLPEVLRAISKPTGIYTNAIRLADKDYLQSLLDAGLDFICISMHTQAYVDNDLIWRKKLQAMENIRSSEALVHHVAFSMSTPEDIDEVLRTSYDFWDMGSHHRLRIPSAIGRCGDESFYLSEFFVDLTKKLEEFNWSSRRMYDDDTRYHVNIEIEGKWFRVIRWPSIDEVDLSELRGPPFCQFDDEIGEVNFVHGALVAAEKKVRNGRQ